MVSRKKGNKMNRIAFPILLVFLFSMISASALAQSNVAYVDLQEALLSSKDGKSIKAKLEKMAKKKKAAIEKAQADLLKEKETLEKQAEMMPEKVRREKAMAFQGKLAQLQESVATSQRELAEEEARLSKPIMNKIRKEVEAIAKERGYDLILEKGTILYGASDRDLTDELVKRLNRK